MKIPASGHGHDRTADSAVAEQGRTSRPSTTAARRIDEATQLLAAIKTELHDGRGMATSDNRVVTATTDLRGRLTDLRIEGRANRTIRADSLGVYVIQAVSRARAAADQQAAERLSQLFRHARQRVREGD